MKIGIDGRAACWYRGTGIGTYTYQLINSLNEIDKDSDYLLFMPENTSFDIPLNANFRLKNIGEKKQDNFWDEINIPNILKDGEIELYHVPQNGVGLPKDKKCPFVITLHDVIPFKMPETVSDNYLRIFHKELPLLLPLCDGVITVSEYSKQDISEAFNYPKEKIHVTYLASEPIYCVINKSFAKRIIKKYYNLEGDYILYIGGFSPRKNILGLIEAFSKLLQSSSEKDLKLVIAGKKGKSYELYKKRAEELHVENDVVFPGFIPLEHLPYLYNSAKLFVYPSFYEGFGLPPLEAMACGVPVVASNVTSIPEIFGNSALLVNPRDVEELYQALYRGLTDEVKRQELIIEGLNKSNSLSWEKTARETLSIYKVITHVAST